MNIHFKDPILFEKLKKATIAKVRVGSFVYGTDTIESDEDFLYIYATSENELLSVIQTQHQLQYKSNNGYYLNPRDIDHNFVSLHNFIKNIINGDSSINYEVIQSEELIGTDLEWLIKYRNNFTTYTIIRSYLGFCNRDIKHYHKYNDKYNKEKRLKHIIRGYIYARDMIDNCFNFNNANEELRSIIINVDNDKQLKKYSILVSNLRKTLTEKFNNKTLRYPQHINVSESICLTNDILGYCKSKSFKNKQKILKDFDLTQFINSYENWVSYE